MDIAKMLNVPTTKAQLYHLNDGILLLTPLVENGQ